MDAIYFATQDEFRRWLAENHNTKTELLVGFYKTASGIPSMSWPDSVDQALCFGWIDGVRKSVDDKRYTIRFTPRKTGSIWSAVNIAKVEKLIANGQMHSAGILSFEKRKDEKSAVYSYENAPLELSPEFEQLFRANEKAWSFFESQAPSYKRTAKFLVMSAKQYKTQATRLDELICDSENELRWARLRR